MSRFFAADLVFPVAQRPIPDGIVVCDDNGTILDVGTTASLAIPLEKAEVHRGILCPGFINTHCHLELSHTKGMIGQKTGITGFIFELLPKRSTISAEQIKLDIQNAEKEMIRNGIVAVGDISNGNETFFQKAKKELLYHTFVEVLAIDPSKAKERFETGKKLKAELDASGLSSSVSPHAPYTMNPALAELIDNNQEEIISIHNQESLAESELFESLSGKMLEGFVKAGFDKSLFRKTGVNSLRSSLPLIKKAKRILLVHNTFTSAEDLEWANAEHPGLYWCTCPNANLYIENKLPDYAAFIKNKARVTIGTDSLASNHSLSVLDEMKIIQQNYPSISFETLLELGTKNGAEFLGRTEMGTLEKGKRPGLNLINGTDGKKLSREASVIKLM